VSLGAVTTGYQADLFRHHRWRSGGLTYVMTGFKPGSSQSITLGFAETHAASCSKGKRIFSVLANGGALWSNVDVFAASGACRTALVLTKTAKADARGSIELRFVAVKQNPMVSFIDIVQV
jgi:Malectin domain